MLIPTFVEVTGEKLVKEVHRTKEFPNVTFPYTVKSSWSGHYWDLTKMFATESCPLHRRSSRIGLFHVI